ncbi:endonuclease V [Desmospora profundinema]|uniref:Endonuclease V n=1 Tax=Desmospora profundinema TaxID=1571184 RepID=A0ABU1ISX8_9BACL|nr:endonuclease V [Desmospora profundinema]MDR6227304.1 deoxyribonuclease V [Desmospora profundinema]
MRKEIVFSSYEGLPQVAAGVDLAYAAGQAAAVIVVMAYPTMEIIEVVSHADAVSAEYVPGLLAFRELPVFLKAWEQLRSNPDLVFFDGNGILHPRRLGLASHASLWIDRPTIGVAKSHFLGSYDSLGTKRGSFSPIVDRGETVGAVLRTQTGRKPVYVSVGNRVTLQNAVDFTMHLAGSESRVPEIIRQADIRTRQWKRQMGEELAF